MNLIILKDLKMFAALGCSVILSNSNTPFIKELYADFDKYIIEVNVIRAINCNGSGRAGHKKMIIRNYS